MPPPKPALWTAVSRGSLEEVGKLLAEGADIEEKGGEFEWTALHAAVLIPVDPLVVRLLLASGADVDARDIYGMTPLHHAVHAGSEAEAVCSVVKAGLLLDYNADVSARNRGENTPLHYAALEDNVLVVELLLAKGADVFAKNCGGLTPRQVATHCSHRDLDDRLQISAMIEAEESRAKWLAFSMGLQERLGAASCVNVLDEGVVRLVLEHV